METEMWSSMRERLEKAGMPMHCPFRVLAVDKDAAHLEYVRSTLDSFGYRVTVCGDQGLALGLLHDRQDEFDLIVVNIDEPYANDEYKFTTFVRYTMDTPIIVTCKEEDSKVILKAMKNGATHFFRKPIGVKVLQFIWRFVIQNRFQLEHKQVTWTSSGETSITCYYDETVEFDGRPRVKGRSDDGLLLLQKQKQHWWSNSMKWWNCPGSRKRKREPPASYMDCCETESSSHGINDPVVFGV